MVLALVCPWLMEFSPLVCCVRLFSKTTFFKHEGDFKKTIFANAHLCVGKLAYFSCTPNYIHLSIGLGIMWVGCKVTQFIGGNNLFNHVQSTILKCIVYEWFIGYGCFIELIIHGGYIVHCWYQCSAPQIGCHWTAVCTVAGCWTLRMCWFDVPVCSDCRL